MQYKHVGDNGGEYKEKQLKKKKKQSLGEQEMMEDRDVTGLLFAISSVDYM